MLETHDYQDFQRTSIKLYRTLVNTYYLLLITYYLQPHLHHLLHIGKHISKSRRSRAAHLSCGIQGIMQCRIQLQFIIVVRHQYSFFKRILLFFHLHTIAAERVDQFTLTGFTCEQKNTLAELSFCVAGSCFTSFRRKFPDILSDY